jgi:hypothetical protein
MINIQWKKIILLAVMISPFLVLVNVWFPLIEHYWVSYPSINEAKLVEIAQSTDIQRLQEISTYELPGIISLSSYERIALANKIIHEDVFSLNTNINDNVDLSADIEDQLVSGTSSFQLLIASLGIVNLLLDAYEQADEISYLQYAYAYLLKYLEFNKHQLAPVGFLWNDHAIAARIYVLVKFWYLYGSDKLSHHEKRLIIERVIHDANFLVKPSHFTVRTNHGVMQNLALLQSVVAFPNLPDASRYRSVALDRLNKQLEYYISSEGVVLEHSAGYHAIGIELIAMYLRYSTLLKFELPIGLEKKYLKSIEFIETLMRPDGSLPVYGNTSADIDKEYLIAKKRNNAWELDNVLLSSNFSERALKPVSGYDIWWNSLCDVVDNCKRKAQTVLAWSNFPSQVHKHADELSINFWADGETWFRSVGYWPYWHDALNDAYSWGANNAPFQRSSERTDNRKSWISASYEGSKVKFSQLERHHEDGFQVVRQVLYIAPNRWIIIDMFSDPKDEEVFYNWITNKDIQLSVLDANKPIIRMSGNSSASNLLLSFDSQQNFSYQIIKGRIEPFGGWIVVSKLPVSVPTIEVKVSPNNWHLTSWVVEEKEATNTSVNIPVMELWKSVGEWVISWPEGQGCISRIKRNRNFLDINNCENKNSNKVELNVYDKDSFDNKTMDIVNSYYQATEEFPRFKDYIYYRVKVSVLIIMLLLLQAFVIFLILRKHLMQVPIAALGVLCWVVLGVWLRSVYFV